MRFLLLLIGLCIFSGPIEASRYHHFLATAYSQRGITKSGVAPHVGVVAADPKVLPLGTVIQVARAGRYSGRYVVADTGSLVIGRHIDVFIPNRRTAVKFGRKPVLVAVLRWGKANDTG